MRTTLLCFSPSEPQPEHCVLLWKGEISDGNPENNQSEKAEMTFCVCVFVVCLGWSSLSRRMLPVRFIKSVKGCLEAFGIG